MIKSPQCSGNRRGTTLVELAVSTLILVVAMTVTTQTLSWIANSRRSAHRRHYALLEVANVMERITADTTLTHSPQGLKQLELSREAKQSLPGAELAIDTKPDHKQDATRLTVSLKWRGAAGHWEAPIRLTTWVDPVEDNHEEQ